MDGSRHSTSPARPAVLAVLIRDRDSQAVDVRLMKIPLRLQPAANGEDIALPSKRPRTEHQLPVRAAHRCSPELNSAALISG